MFENIIKVIAVIVASSLTVTLVVGLACIITDMFRDYINPFHNDLRIRLMERRQRRISLEVATELENFSNSIHVGEEISEQDIQKIKKEVEDLRNAFEE